MLGYGTAIDGYPKGGWQAELLQFSNEKQINVFHNEPELWNTEMNAMEEAEELADKCR